MSKNFTIVLGRKSISAIVIAFLLPIGLTIFFSQARNLFIPPSVFGIGNPQPVKTFSQALAAAGNTGRDNVVFVNNGLAGGDIDRVIDALVPSVVSAGKNATRAALETDLNTLCRSSLRGVTQCFGAVVFRSSPREGPGGIWNYTIRTDGALGTKVDVYRNDNDAQVYLMPIQRAVDAAIASLNSGPDQGPLPETTNEYPFTDLTQEERAVRIRVLYQAAIMNWLGVSFMTSVLFITYHMTGFIVTERESGMTQLVDAMMPVRRRWHAQAARMLSYHLSFALIYLPGWVIGSLILRQGVFARTNVGIVLIYHILIGMAMASLSLLVSSLFKKAQLSGNSAVLGTMLLGILAQSVSWPRSTTVGILSFLFAPCNYVYFITFMARYEQKDTGTNLVRVAPDSPWQITGIVLWIFVIIQIFGYALLAGFIESQLHGTTTKGRTITFNTAGTESTDAAVRLEGFTKIYKPSALRRLFSFISKPKEPVVAVNGLTLEAGRGQILALLGANGSGKSTTLDSIAGMNKITTGSITIDGTGGLGITPQKNVLWDDLTVEEHLKYFNRLKSTGAIATKQELRALIKSIDLEPKRRARAKTLSGGQKRKLQLGMMLTGGSAVCCVDEVSSGLDPLSRRKIWDILLAERGRRTLILTTHFLDEADLLADHIAILSKGTLRAEGSSVELKDKLGGGYRIHVHKHPDVATTPDIDGVEKKVDFDVISYVAPSSGLAAQVIRTLEADGITDYRFSGPTIEDVFLQLAEEVKGESGDEHHSSSDSARQTPQPGEKDTSAEKVVAIDDPSRGGLKLLDGKRIGYFQQAGVLFRKRYTIVKRNWIPYLTAFLLPVVAAGLVTLFIKGQEPIGCSPADQGSSETAEGTFNQNDLKYFLVAGPQSKFSQSALIRLFLPVFGAQVNSSNGTTSGGSGLTTATRILQNLTLVDTYDAFNTFIVDHRKNVTPAGLWLGDAGSLPTVAYRGNGFFINPMFGQNFLDILLANTSIAMSWAPFDIPWAPNTGDSLQLLVYTGIALSAYPGFFALYPSIERRRNVRGLEYSNGVRPLPLWMAYLAFDFAIVIASTALVTILWATLSNVWYHIGYIFVIFMFYGLTAILLAYVISLFCKTQLSTYAWVAASQAVAFLVYLIAYLCTITYAPVTKIDSSLLIVHFVVSAFAPIGSVIRALFLALNLFSTTCDGDKIASNPGGILQYGGPILYLIIQSIFLFLILIWVDGGAVGSSVRRLWQSRLKEVDDPTISDEEVANELVRVTSTNEGNDGLRVMHVTKTFGRNTAVDNVTFGIKRGEVFALLGPNGAGKSTTISLIRGDIQPSRNGGDIFVEDQSVIRNLAAARSHLGVCPQFDAMDLMTVREHLEFYARIRGIADIEHNVSAVLRAVGLEAFAGRMAHALSGGNKRKLSLGIALMGNPTVVLLDEPSCGLDAAAKRIMWKTLAATVPGRSILLTTHSMEEADALASRAGILAKRMLAMGTTDQLRDRFGDALHIHLVSNTAPRTPPQEMERVLAWVTRTFPGAACEEQTYHGQMRFAVPASSVAAATSAALGNKRLQLGKQQNQEEIVRVSDQEVDMSKSAIGQLVVLLEERKAELGIKHFSVTPTTLDQVFLSIVGRHNVQEENSAETPRRGWWDWR
jgi:ATP-binding cassette, subfamily A (ABC1), member 3